MRWRRVRLPPGNCHSHHHPIHAAGNRGAEGFGGGPQVPKPTARPRCPGSCPGPSRTAPFAPGQHPPERGPSPPEERPVTAVEAWPQEAHRWARTSRSKTDEQNPVVPGTSAPEIRADAYDSHSEPGTIRHTRLGQSDDGLSGPSLRGPSLSLPGKLRPGEAERPAAGTVSGRLAAGPPCPSPPSSAWL